MTCIVLLMILGKREVTSHQILQSVFTGKMAQDEINGPGARDAVGGYVVRKQKQVGGGTS